MLRLYGPAVCIKDVFDFTGSVHSTSTIVLFYVFKKVGGKRGYFLFVFNRFPIHNSGNLTCKGLKKELNNIN